MFPFIAPSPGERVSPGLDGDRRARENAGNCDRDDLRSNARPCSHRHGFPFFMR
jgi:hypothetical protein